MKRVFHMELHKALHSWFFLAAVCCGGLFAILSFVDRVSNYFFGLGVLNMVDAAERMGYVKYPIVPMSTVYNEWLGGEGLSLGYTLFFTLLPLLAVLPYGYSFSEELRGGYLKMVVPRCGRRRYFLAKAGASFLSGGLAVTIPLAASLFFCFLIFPAAKPNVIYDQYFPFTHSSMLAGLVYSHPLLYMLLYLGIDFVFAGLFACLSISSVFFFRQRLASVVLPFLFVLGCDMLRSFGTYVSYVEISPMRLMHAVPTANFIKAPVLLGWLCLFVLLTLPLILYRGCKHEIF